MKYVSIAIIIVALALIMLFKVQNLTGVTITLLGMSINMPVSVLVFGVYLLGMFTGGALWSLLRNSFRSATGGGS